MRSNEFAPPNHRFVTHATDTYRGQTNFITSLIVDGQEVGSVEYSVYNDEPQIDMIYIDPEHRRRGYATVLARELQRLYPDYPVKFGMLTPDGSSWHKSLKFEPTVDQDIEAKHQKLRSIRGELARLNNKLETLRRGDIETARRWLATVGDRWNKLHDLEHKYEQEVYSAGPSTKKFLR